MLRRLACLLLPAASVALLPDPPFECDNARCRVRPRGTIYAAERVCAPGNYTCASCCDPGPDCRCGADSFEHATAPTANATAVRLHLRAAFPDRAAHLAALSDAHAVEAFKGLACRPCLRGPYAGEARPKLTRRCPHRPGARPGAPRATTSARAAATATRTAPATARATWARTRTARSPTAPAAPSPTGGAPWATAAAAAEAAAITTAAAGARRRPTGPGPVLAVLASTRTSTARAREMLASACPCPHRTFLTIVRQGPGWKGNICIENSRAGG